MHVTPTRALAVLAALSLGAAACEIVVDSGGEGQSEPTTTVAGASAPTTIAPTTTVVDQPGGVSTTLASPTTVLAPTTLVPTTVVEPTPTTVAPTTVVPPTTAVPAPGPVTPELQLVASGLDGATFATSAPGDDRLFVVEKAGRIRIVDGDDKLLPEPFLDITSLVSAGNEQGLLGLAFHPGYVDNGRFFVSYTDTAGDTRLVEYGRADANRASPTPVSVLFEQDQPYGNHNGGMVAFGPDGMLYLALGDGGSADDPGDVAQDPAQMLGKMLRFEVKAASPVPQVWASGLRNPWRFSFDTATGLLYIADVGQNAVEEINAAPADSADLDYGWDTLEGSQCHEPNVGCDPTGTQLPILEYGHDQGQSITGGYVYRGSALPDLVGHYFYGDAVGSWIRSFKLVDGKVTEETDWSSVLGRATVWSFGTDAEGELYVMGGDSIHRFVAAPTD